MPERGRKGLVGVDLNLTSIRFLAFEWYLVNPCFQNWNFYAPSMHEENGLGRKKMAFPKVTQLVNEVASTLSQVPAQSLHSSMNLLNLYFANFLYIAVFFSSPHSAVVPSGVLLLINYIFILPRDQDINLLG